MVEGGSRKNICSSGEGQGAETSQKCNFPFKLLRFFIEITIQGPKGKISSYSITIL